MPPKKERRSAKAAFLSGVLPATFLLRKKADKAAYNKKWREIHPYKKRDSPTLEYEILVQQMKKTIEESALIASFWKRKAIKGDRRLESRTREDVIAS